MVFDAEIEALLEARLKNVDIVAELTAQGFSSVAVDEHGCTVEYRANGTTVVLE